jgi:hypothetical protein
LKDALDLGYAETWHNSHMHMGISMEVLCVVKYASLLNYLIHIILLLFVNEEEMPWCCEVKPLHIVSKGSIILDEIGPI